MRISFRAKFCLAAIISAIVCVLGWPTNDIGQPPDSNVIEVTSTSHDSVIEVTDESPLDVVFQVANRGTASAGPFQIHHTCRCKIRDGLPQVLPPGGRGEFSVRVIPPVWGELALSVGVGVGEPESQRISVPFRIRNKSPRARIFASPENIEFAFSRGDTVEQTFSIWAIEPDQQPPSFRDVRIVPAMSSQVEFFKSEDIQTDVPGVVRRCYHFSLSHPNTTDSKSENGMLVWGGNLAGPKEPAFQIPIRVTVREPLFVAPAKLLLNGSRSRGQIHIVRRSKSFVIDDIRLESRDSSPMTIERTTGASLAQSGSLEAAFDVTVADKTLPFKSVVRFVIDGTFPMSIESQVEFAP